MTQSGFEPATFRFVAQYLNHCATISGPPYVPLGILITPGLFENSRLFCDAHEKALTDNGC
jgi:hypothetical protein